MKSKNLTDTELAYHVSRMSIGANTLLSIGKVLAGIFANSGAMITDGIHSASDVISTFVVILGIKLSNKDADADHEYGHEKLECMASLVLGTFLLATGLGIGWVGLEKIFSGNIDTLAIPGILALVAALVSIVVKEAMYWYTRYYAKKINSTALMADAWHHRSDSLSSIGAFIGILGARLGFAILDPIASLVICVFIAKAAYDILKDATDKLVDKSCDAKVEKAMKEKLEKLPGVYKVDALRTRLSGSRVFVDTEISADQNFTFIKSHEIAENAHNAILEDFPQVKSCMVHINPILISE